MSGYIKTWNVDRIIGDLRSAYYVCTDSKQTGFTTWPIKQDLYRVKWALDDMIRDCPTFLDEAEFLKEHEQEKLVRVLSKDY